MNIRRPTHPIFGRLMYGVVLAMLIIAALGLGGFTPARAAPLAAPPPPPSDLIVTQVTSSEVQLAWTDNSGGTASFVIERSDGQTDWAEIGTTPAGTTTFTDANLTGSFPYYYSVYATSGGETSDYSNTASTNTGIYLPYVIRSGPFYKPAKVFDVTISLYNNPTGAQREPYENIIRFFADGVYEVSNGAHKIGKVQIFPNGQYADQANVIWQDRGWPCANVGGYGREGQQVQMFDLFASETQVMDNYLEPGAGQQRGGYGAMVHEWGHYFYGLYDEYKGSNACGGRPSSPCNQDVPPQNVTMHNSDCAAVNEDGSPGNLQCLNLSTSKNVSQQTAQYRVYEASSWDTIVRTPTQDPFPNNFPERPYYPELADFAPAAGQDPTIELTDDRSEPRSDLQIIWMSDGSSGLTANAVGGSVIRQIVIESSNTMSAQLTDVKSAIKEVIDAAEDGEMIGIINFADQVNVAAPLTSIDATSRNTLKTIVDGITASGNRAAIGDATAKALENLTVPAVPVDRIRTVYLIADGESTNGRDPLSVLEDAQNNDIAIYTFGYSATDEAADTLWEMAEQTDGQYYDLGGSEVNAGLTDLLDALNDANENSSPIVDVTLVEGAEVVGQPVPFYVDSTLGELEAQVAYAGSGALVELVAPGGGTNAFNCETFGAGAEQDTFCQYSVTDPPTGDWQITFTGGTATDFFYQVTASAKPGDYTLDAVISTEDGDESFLYSADNSSVTIVASISDGQYDITDIAPTLQVEYPDGTTGLLTLRDDGQAPDWEANDGIYTAMLDLQQNGYHYLTAMFDNNAGTAKFTDFGLSLKADPATGLPAEHKTPWPVGTNFTRTASTEILIEGVP